jgi:hypothetical protein
MYQKSPRKEIIFMEMSFKKPIKKSIWKSPKCIRILLKTNAGGKICVTGLHPCYTTPCNSNHI